MKKPFLMIDNYDSFVYNLVRYFEELGEEIRVYRNDAITREDIVAMDPIGIVISPGPKNPEDVGISAEIIKEFARNIPILGVCLGHQTIAYVYGSKIIEAKKPAHGKISAINHDGKGVYKGLPNSINVTRYHSLIIDENTLAPSLEVTSRTKDGLIMGIRHKKYLLEGVQFHPEAELTEHGYDIISNYIEWCKGITAKK